MPGPLGQACLKCLLLGMMMGIIEIRLLRGKCRPERSSPEFNPNLLLEHGEEPRQIQTTCCIRFRDQYVSCRCLNFARISPLTIEATLFCPAHPLVVFRTPYPQLVVLLPLILASHATRVESVLRGRRDLLKPIRFSPQRFLCSSSR